MEVADFDDVPLPDAINEYQLPMIIGLTEVEIKQPREMVINN